MTPLSEYAAATPAEPALFAHLIDDAAVFPPGNAPLPQAVSDHRFHQATPYAALLGPLLVPASAAADFIDLVGGKPAVGPAFRVIAVARPGTERAVVEDGAAALHTLDGVELAGVEFGWVAGWRDLTLPDVPLAIEVPRGEHDQAQAIADIAREGGDSARLQAKFRTGATETWPWPDEAELARFIRTAVDHDLGFKLTGGLHHAVRSEQPDGPQHGLLNVLCAVRGARDGEAAEKIAPLLAEQDPATLVSQVSRMSAPDAASVRATFTAFGCCGVLDPIRDLRMLNLITDKPVGPV
jgi:hypothetical protein